MIRRFHQTTAAIAIAFLSGCGQTPPTPEKEAKAVAEPKPTPPEPEKPKPTLRQVTIPAGTLLSVRTASQASTQSSRAGEIMEGTLEAPLKAGDIVVAPRGASAGLLVTKSDPGGRVKGRASIGVRLGSLQIAGQARTVSTSIYVREAPGTKKKDAVTAGVASGVGAAIGAIAGGGKGAAIGAGAGAGAGTGVVLATRGAPAVIPAESVLQFRLQQPLTVQIEAAP